jgi:hypothetical protein
VIGTSKEQDNMNLSSTAFQLILNGALTGNGTTLLQTVLVEAFIALREHAAKTATPWDDRILDAIINAANAVKKQV